MKNLKKAMSLTLAATMAMSLMSTAAFAKDEAYTDAGKVNFNEAVDVMSAAGVFQGSNGAFNPQGDLTRESAAKIITYMLMGKANADQLKAGEAPYADVAADRWSAGAIAYCTAQGIVAGSNGNFYPTQKVTGVQFAKMLLVALGYDAKIEKMVGPSWAIYTSTLAVSADLNADMENVLLSAPLTREQAALMAFNAMKADVVKYTNKGTEIKLADGTTVMMGATPAEKIAHTPDYVVGGTDTNLQFIEKYFDDLKLDADETDDMGRPANIWKDNGTSETIGTYSDAADYTFVATEKDGKNQTLVDLVKDVNKNLKFAAATVTVNQLSGQTGSTKEAKVKAGANVELFLNDTGKVSKAVITEYTVKELAADVATKTKDDVDYISVPGVTAGYVKAETVNGAEGLVDEDVVLVTADKEKNLYIKKAASVKGVVTGNHSVKGLQVNGTFYDKSPAEGVDVAGWSNDFKNTYTFYLNDANQIVKAVKETNEAAANYAAVVDAAWVAGSGINGTNYVEAKIVKPDGSTEIVKVASVDGFKPIKADDAVLANDLYYASGANTDAKTSNSKAAAGKFYYEKNDVAEETAGVTLTAKYFGVNESADLFTTQTDGQLFVNASDYSFDTKTAALLTKNAVYSYEIDKDGKYELSAAGVNDDLIAPLGTAVLINPKNPALGAVATANDKTVFVYAVVDGDDTTYTAYTGIKNAPEVKDGDPAMGGPSVNNEIANNTVNAVVYDKTTGFASLVFAVVDTKYVAGTAEEDLVYITDKDDYTTMKNGDDAYVVYNAIVNGVAQEIKLTAKVEASGMYYVSAADANGYKTLTGVTGAQAVAQTGVQRIGGGAFVTAENTYSYNDKTAAYYIDEDGNSTEMNVESLSLDATDKVWVVVDSKEATLAAKIYVVEHTQEASALTVDVAGAGTISNESLYVAGAKVTGTKLGTTTLAVTAGATANMKYTVSVKGNGAAAVEQTESSDKWGDAAATAAYKTVTGDTVVTVVVTAEDGFSGLTSVYTYEIAL